MSDLNQPRPSGTHRAAGDADRPAPNVDDLQADIEKTREQLADTVDQLQAKLDVKARASASVHDITDKAKDRVVDPQGNPRPAALGAGGAVLAGLVAVVVVVLWRRHQQQQRVLGMRWR